MAKTVWQDAFVIKVYNLSRSGLNETQIAKALGIASGTFKTWESKKKAFKAGLEIGRKEYKGKKGKTPNFKDYVFQRLPFNLRKIWKRINKLDKAKNGFEAIEAILDSRGKSVRQHLFVYAWVHSNFSISQALRKVNLSRGTFDVWRKTDPEFAKLIEEINWHKKNFFEDHLCALVASGDRAAILFVNETYNRDRGYNKKVEIDMNLSGEIDQNIMSVDVMQLPLQTRKEILKSLRKNKENQKTSDSKKKMSYEV